MIITNIKYKILYTQICTNPSYGPFFFFTSLTLKSRFSFLIYHLLLSPMWSRSGIRLWTTLLPCLAPLYLAFLLYHLTCTVVGGMPYTYTLVDNILLNCGSSGNSTALDGRTWVGDVNSKFSPLEQSQNQTSLKASAVLQSPSAVQFPMPLPGSLSPHSPTCSRSLLAKNLFDYTSIRLRTPTLIALKPYSLSKPVVLLFLAASTLHLQQMPMVIRRIPYSENTMSTSRMIRG
jgi:hypothetical protein